MERAFLVRTTLLVLAAVLVAAPAAARADVIHALNDSPTDTFTQGAQSGATPRGWDFRVNAANVEVVELGVNAARSSSIPIVLSLWDVSAQLLLAQATTVPAPGWDFVQLTSPVQLIQGRVYSVTGWADTTGSSAWYQFNNDPPASFTPTGDIEYLNGRFANDVGRFTFPTSTLPPRDQYGVADIGYDFASPAPEPSTLTLLTLGTLGAFGYAWRRRGRAPA
jgi:hypothetical protein